MDYQMTTRHIAAQSHWLFYNNCWFIQHYWQIYYIQFTQFSDHASLYLDIKIKNVNFTDELITDYELDYGVERKTFKWRDEYKSQCKEALSNNIDNFNSLHVKI